jgi:16S rRNA (guanine527-N7)-methyltransferase
LTPRTSARNADAGTADRLHELADAHGLSEAQRELLDTLLTLLTEDPLAPTAIRDRARALETHLADSLTALEVDALGRAEAVSDIGSGAGLPGLVLAIARPEAPVRLVESQRRKCDFIARAALALKLENAQVVCARIEEWNEGRGRSDVVVARALAAQPVVLEYAAPLLRLGGTLIDFRGPRVATDEMSALVAAAELGLTRAEIQTVAPFAGAEAHHLHVFVKETETPGRFPRRAGVARKRPLGAAV